MGVGPERRQGFVPTDVCACPQALIPDQTDRQLMGMADLG